MGWKVEVEESRAEIRRLTLKVAILEAALDNSRVWGAELGRRLVALDQDADTMLEPKPTEGVAA